MKARTLESGRSVAYGHLASRTAVCDANGISATMLNERNPFTEQDEMVMLAEEQKKASGIIVSALSNNALRVVHADVANPFMMLSKLTYRYDSKTVAYPIARMTELVSLRYNNIKKDIGMHVDKIEGVLEKLAGMNTPIPHELSIAIPIAISIAIDSSWGIDAILHLLKYLNCCRSKLLSRLCQRKHRPGNLCFLS